MCAHLSLIKFTHLRKDLPLIWNLLICVDQLQYQVGLFFRVHDTKLVGAKLCLAYFVLQAKSGDLRMSQRSKLGVEVWEWGKR